MTTLTTIRSQPSYPIHELYRRLGKVGFNQNFVRKYVLPDWWEDQLSVNPATRAMAEMYISRMIGVSIQNLRTPDAPLRSSHPIEFRLKRNKNVTEDELLPAIMLTQALGNIFSKTLDILPEFRSGYSLNAIRQEILENRTSVDLFGLLDWSWRHGIIVVHLTEWPIDAKKFQGIAMLCGERPVIVLAHGSDSPPWLAFHLAHELGHILCGHIKRGQTLVDERIEWNIGNGDSTEDPIVVKCESEANEFALRLLTSFARFDSMIDPSLTAGRIVKQASLLENNYAINPGTWALIHGYATGHMGAAQNALKMLGLEQGAHQIISDMVKRYLPDDAPESLVAFLPLINCEL